MQNEAEFSLPLADHTYALDRFPTDEVPSVLAFEEVESERTQVHQSLFSIVEEHAYAHRIQKLPDDEWTNFPDVAGPDCLDAAVQTDPVIDQVIQVAASGPVPDPVPSPTTTTIDFSAVSFISFIVWAIDCFDLCDTVLRLQMKQCLIFMFLKIDPKVQKF